MKVTVLSEQGFGEALFGLGLSYGLTSDLEFVNFTGPFEPSEVHKKLMKLSNQLAHKDGGHNKFLESIQVWLDIDAPRFWWSEFDTYRAGVTKQSESTMHTLNKRPLTQEDFEYEIPDIYLGAINRAIKEKVPLTDIKNGLPEGFLQRRIVNTNYKTLRNILWQREGHRLPQWQVFRDAVLAGVNHPKLLVQENSNA